MSDNVLSHNEMCRREGVSLQRGMNFGLGGNHSVTEFPITQEFLIESLGWDLRLLSGKSFS